MTMKNIRQINSPQTITEKYIWIFPLFPLAMTGWGLQDLGSLGRWAKISISSWLSTQLTSDISMQDWQEGWNILASFLVFLPFLVHLRWVYIAVQGLLRVLRVALWFSNSLKPPQFHTPIVEKSLFKEIIPKALEFDFQPDFLLNCKIKLNKSISNTPLKWWIICMLRQKRQIVQRFVRAAWHVWQLTWFTSVQKPITKSAWRKLQDSLLSKMSKVFSFVINFTNYNNYETILNSFIVWTKRGLLLTDPIERGLRVIEISILTEAATPHPTN